MKNKIKILIISIILSVMFVPNFVQADTNILDDLENKIINESLYDEEESTQSMLSNSGIAAYSLEEYEGTLLSGKGDTLTHVVKDGKTYLYSRTNGANFIEIDRYCVEDSKFEKNVYKKTVGSVFTYFVKDNVIYTMYYDDDDSSVSNMLGYDTVTDTVVYEEEFAVARDDFGGTFCIDSNKNFYFITEEDSGFVISSYDKNGNLIDSITLDGISSTYCPELICTNNANTVLFLASYYQIGSSHWYNDHYLVMDNGTFTNTTLYTYRQYGGINWHFINDDCTLGYTQYGEFYEINYNDETSESGISIEIKDTVTYNGTYQKKVSNNNTIEGNYIWFGGYYGIIYKYNYVENVIEQSIDIGSEKLIKGVYKDEDTLNIEYYSKDDYKYYWLSIDVSELSEVGDYVITDHTTLSHTKEEISSTKSQYAIVNKTSDVYEELPSISSVYSAGSLKEQVKTDTLNQVNYFRYLAGLGSVTINEDYMEYSQKGAVILAANNVLTHYPTQPSDMDDDFYSAGYKATSAKIANSGDSANISQGTLMAYSIKSYVDDTSNASGDVGHRLSILDPLAYSISFGYAYGFGVVNVFENADSTENGDMYYAWPSAGYFPADAIKKNAMWSFNYSTGKLQATSLYVKLTANGKTYSTANGDFTAYKDSSYDDVIYYSIPSELKTYLTDGGSSFIGGKSVEVEVGSFVDNLGNNYTYKYTIDFYVEEIKGDVNQDGYVNSTDAALVLDCYKNNSSTDKDLRLGDMDENGVLNSTDAAMILDIYKNS